MTTPERPKRLSFIKSFEINGVSPLPHYYEEIYTNQVGVRKLGFRGDKNYLFYSINGLGAGYYEEYEMSLAAQSVYDHFKAQASRRKFFRGIQKLLITIHETDRRINRLKLDKLSTQELARLFVEANQLHGWAFSYYVISQPYRMKVFEQEVTQELSKRVAGSRIDSYMAQLATSEKPTKVTEEELDWLRFLIKYKTKFPGNIDTAHLESEHPRMYSDLKKHFEQYKSLTLGDGNWTYDINHYVTNLKNDYKRDLNELQKTYKERSEYAKATKSRRNQLISELRLSKQTVRDMAFLADIGHTRLVMRIDGWLPFVSTIIKLDIELSKRLNLNGPYLNYMTEAELITLADEGKMVPENELLARQGKNQEFMILNDHGEDRMFYGSEAGKKFKQLVPSIDHQATTELTGTTAVMGNIKGKVCVYLWGDDLKSKLAIIKKYPILVTGQTRPSMMPIIRLAKGIATDEGGITSHAAIVSRELGIPAVIGTVHGTRVFKDGDMVELDADNGVIRKLS